MHKINYKSFVGPGGRYYINGARFFTHLVRELGLKPTDKLLDIGCGSLRIGRQLIPFLDSKRYYGVEPEEKWVKDGLKHEFSADMIDLKFPEFYYGSDFDFKTFNISFDVAIAMQVFIHCGADQLRQCLNNLYGCLTPTGCALLTVRIGNKTKEIPYPTSNKRYNYSSHKTTIYNIHDFNKIVSDTKFKGKQTKTLVTGNAEGVTLYKMNK